MISLLRKTAAVILSIFALALAANAQVTSDQSAQIDHLFSDWDSMDTPGTAVGIVQDGQLIFSKGYGMADLEHDIPINPDSVFYAASVSKQFVTMAVLLLEEQGKLGLDDEIQRFLPDFPEYDSPLTIRHFIHHTSGVRDSLTLWELSGRDIYDYVSKDAMYELIKRQKELNFKPGEQYLYSNACYFMLALIVEKVSGQPIREFAEKHMFKTLGMKDTHFHDDMYHIVKNRVFSYSPSSDGYKNLIMRFDLVGSGGLYTTVNDLLLWDRNFYNNKLGKERPELIAKMQEDGRLNSGESAGYAFGLSNGVHRGLRTVQHGGALAGYRTYLLRYPDQNFSVIVLANVSSFNAGGKARELAEIFLEKQFTEDAQETGQSSPGSLAFDSVLTEKELRPFVANYYSRETGLLAEVIYESSGLTMQSENFVNATMVPLSADLFWVQGEQFEFDVDFEITATGESAMTASFKSGSTIAFESYEPADVSIEEIAKISGRYYSDEVDAYYELELENGELVLHVAGERQGPLVPIKKGLLLSDEFGYFEFTSDGIDGTSGFTLDAGRVKNLQFAKL